MRLFFRCVVVAAVIIVALSSLTGSSSIISVAPTMAGAAPLGHKPQALALATWHSGGSYKPGDLVMYQGIVYECLHANIAQDHAAPNITPSLWMSRIPSTTDPNVWQPSSIQYDQDTEILYHGRTYKALKGNVSQPATAPATSPGLWQLLPTPRFVNAPCPMDLTAPGISLKYHEGGNLRCGYLIALEDRQNADSPEIRLAVAIVKSNSLHPAPDPLIMLQGGPGGSLLKDFDFFTAAAGAKAVVGDRDIILLDQRGTGFSTPSLSCHELFDLQDATTEQLLSIAQSTAASAQAYLQCRQRLASEHIDLNAYNTYNDANDIHDLIAALRLPQVNLYGVSYGTRLALEVMRSFPQNVRSVILDSTVPADLHFYETIPHDYARVFQTLFQGCASDANCARLHPNLASRFYHFIAATDQHPITMQLVNGELGKAYPHAVMRGYDIFLGFWQMFYVTSWISAIPKLMEMVISGNDTVFEQLYSALAFDTSVNAGVYESVICGEAAGHNAKDRIAQTAQELDPAVRSDVVQDMYGQAFSTCGVWNVHAVDASQGQAVQSSIPALVMEGEYDPITPPTNGDTAAKSLAHSYVTLFPATGHGVYLSSQACPVQVALSFLAAPSQQPNSSCIQTMAEPAFL